MLHLLLFLLADPAFSEPGRFCVNNRTAATLDWSVRDSKTRMLAASTRDHEPASWHCLTIEEDGKGRDYALRISDLEWKFGSEACYSKVKANTWAEVRPAEGGGLECVVASGQGEPQKVTKAPIFKFEQIWLRGSVYFGRGVHGAKVRLLSPNGKVVGEATTDQDGLFRLRVRAPSRSGFVLTATGGSDSGAQVPGALKAVIGPSFDFESERVGVNLPSTLVAELSGRQKNEDIPSLESQVKQFLGLPEWAKLGERLNSPTQQIYGSQWMASQAREKRSIDGFVRELAFSIERNEGLGAYPLNPGMLRVDFSNDWVADKIGGGIISAAAGSAFTMLMGELGWKSDAQKSVELLKQLSARLEQIQNQLRSIENLITEGEYNTRSGKLYTFFIDPAIDMSLELTALNKDLASSVNAVTGEVTNKALNKEVLEKLGNLRYRAIDKLGGALRNINRELVGEGGTNENASLLRLFARNTLPTLLTNKYYESLSKHLEQYRSAETTVLTLLTAAYGGGQSTGQLNSLIDSYKEYSKKEKVMLSTKSPIALLFGTAGNGLSEQMMKGNLVYDHNSMLLWRAQSVRSKNRADLIQKMQYELGTNWVAATNEHYRSLATSIGNPSFLQGLIGTGFKLAGSNNTIYTGWSCWAPDSEGCTKNPLAGQVSWFNATQGPWKESVVLSRHFYAMLAAAPDPLFHAHMVFYMPPGKNYGWLGNMPVHK